MSTEPYARRWPLAAAVVFLIFVLLSLEPVYKLKENAPQEFKAVVIASGIDQQRWSDRYWERARFLQWKYSYGTKLPDEPVADFHIEDETTLPVSLAEQTRLAYWNKLRQVWLAPTSWTVSYSLDFGWTRRTIEKAADAAIDFVKGFWRAAR